MDLEYESSPIPTLNIITNKSQKEFVLDLIGQIPDGNMKRAYLERLKTLILEQEDKRPTFSLMVPRLLSQMFINTFLFQTPISKLPQKICKQKLMNSKLRSDILRLR